MHQVIYPSLDVRYIGLPVNNETTNEDGVIVGNNITADPAIRQAINVGIDRQAMVEGAYNGLGNVSYIGTSNLLPWASDYKIEDGKVDEAKQILAAAGWTDTNGDGIVEKDGELKLRFHAFSNNLCLNEIALSKEENFPNMIS